MRKNLGGNTAGNDGNTFKTSTRFIPTRMFRGGICPLIKTLCMRVFAHIEPSSGLNVVVCSLIVV